MSTVKELLKTPKDKTQFKKWLQALRSGKYKQAQGRLESPKGGEYCCLGVACKVLVPEAAITKELATTPGSMFTKSKTVEVMTGTSPNNQGAAPAWLKALAHVSVGPRRQNVMVYNDADKATFAEIADILEAEVK